MNEQALKHKVCIKYLKMRLNIFKDKITVLKAIHTDKNILNTNKDSNKTLGINEETENKIPQFMTLSKLDWDNNEIHAGIIKDQSAKGGLRYQIIEPILSERDQKAFEIIKKLLMTELSVSLGEIKSKKDAERRLKNKIASMIKK